MRKSCHLTLALWCAAAGTAGAQNAAVHSTPQTQNATPAALRSAGSGASNAVSGPTNAASSGIGGANAASRSRGGSGAARKAPSPAATARVVVTGDADGNGVPDRGAVLPGVSPMHNALGVATGVPIQVRLQQPVDSGHAKNGDTLRGSLAAPLGRFPAGAPVQLTVVASAPAGQLNSRGELSLQVVSVNGEQILSDVITAEGKEGAKILPDDAPAPGTEAIFTADQTITLPAA